MKDSGVKWIGQVPEGWEIKKLGEFYSQRNEKVSDKDYTPLSVTMQGILPQLETAAKTNDGDNRKLVCKGDFAINSRSDRRGSCGISPYNGSVSLINTVLMPKGRMSTDFYNWLFHTSMFADEYYRWGHGIVDDLWTTRWSEMKNIQVIYPPLPEQLRISAYLDEKCGDIDRCVSVQEEMIEELKAYKQSVITEAVTKGLDPKAKLKPSGIEWIGEIPEGWEILPVNYCFQEVVNLNTNLEENNALQFKMGEIISKKEGNSKYIPETLEGYNIVEPGDIMINGLNLSFDLITQRVAMVRDNGVITSTYLAIRPKDNTKSSYAQYLLKAYDNAKALHGMGRGLRATLAYNYFRREPFILPPLPEQHAIANYLDAKTSEIDSLIALKQQKINELKEYKKSLIYECVTGKKEIV